MGIKTFRETDGVKLPEMQAGNLLVLLPSHHLHPLEGPHDNHHGHQILDGLLQSEVGL